MQQITPCLMFDDKIEEAVNFYISVFKNSKITNVTYYGDGAHKPKGSVLAIDFQLDGQMMLALDSGEHLQFTPAISLMVDCNDQQELDATWEALLQGGGEGQCGWLKDKYGVSWQVIPANLAQLMSDPTKNDKVIAAIMTMKKLDIATLEKAYNS